MLFFKSLVGGGGFSCFDVNTENYVVRPFSESAPKYSYVRSGLNIEGYCRNSMCNAHNERVIDMCDMGVFTFNHGKFHCPLCHDVIEHIQPLFTACQFMTEGVKSNDETHESKWFKQDRYNYKMLDESSGACYWDYLIIKTKPLDQHDDSTLHECSICLSDIDKNNRIITSYKHEFHSACLGKWKQLSVDEHSTCPYCRNEIVG